MVKGEDGRGRRVVKVAGAVLEPEEVAGVVSRRSTRSGSWSSHPEVLTYSGARAPITTAGSPRDAAVAGKRVGRPPVRGPARFRPCRRA